MIEGNNVEPPAAGRQLEPLVGPDADEAENFRPMCCGDVLNGSCCPTCGKDRTKSWKYFGVQREIRQHLVRASRLIELRAPDVIVVHEIIQVMNLMLRFMRFP